MPLEMQFSDEYGNDNPNSYWEIDFFSFSNRGFSAFALFLGWKDKESYLAGKTPIQKKEIFVTDKEKYLELAKLLAPHLVPIVYGEAIKDNFFKDSKIKTGE